MFSRLNLVLFSLFLHQYAYATDDLVSLYNKATVYDAGYRSDIIGLEADRQELVKSKALFYPKIQFNGSVGRGVTDRVTSTNFGAVESHLNYGTKNYSLTVKQPIYNKEISAGYQYSQAYVSAKESLMSVGTARLMKTLVTSYLDLMYAHDKLNLLKSSISNTEQQLKQAEQQFKQGAGTVVQVSQVQANLDLANADLVQAKNALDDNRQVLFDLTGEMENTYSSLVPNSLMAEFSNLESLDFWLSTAIQQNQEILAKKFEIDSAKQNLEKSRAGHYPVLDLVGVRSYSSNDSNNTLGSSFDTTTIALQMSMPIYTGGYVSANVKQAALNLDAADAEMNAKQREVLSNVRKYFNGVQSNLRAVAAFQQAVKSAQLAFEAAKKANYLGFKSNIDVLEEQQKLDKAQDELNKSLYMLVGNYAQLKFSAGVLDVESLYKISAWFNLPKTK